jgi:hypothetical protein
MKIYQVEATITVYVAAVSMPSYYEAKEALKSEVEDGGGAEAFQVRHIGEVRDIKSVDEDWKKSIPWATDPEDPERDRDATCEDILKGQKDEQPK